MPRRGNLGRGRRRGMVRLQTMTDCEPRPCYGSVARKHTCEKERGHQDECGCRHGNYWINPERWEQYWTEKHWKYDFQEAAPHHVTDLRGKQYDDEGAHMNAMGSG